MKLTIDEVAASLNLPGPTVDRWIRQGRIPIRKDKGSYVFNKSVIAKWAKNHNLSFAPLENKAVLNPDFQPETILDAMRRGGVFYNIKGNDAKNVLKSASEAITILHEDLRKDLYARLIEREELASTGIGKGIAMPHPRGPLSDTISASFISTFFTKQPVNFKAVDDMPVFILFCLVSTSVKTHLHLLSRLSFCVRDDSFVDFLRNAPQPDILFSKIADFEKRMD